MKKKRLKIIGKICCIVLLFTVILSVLVVPSFAWQNKNNMSEVYWRGVNSYALAPISSCYYSYPNFDGSITNYSINIPNQLTFVGRRNFSRDGGFPLSSRVVETFGQHGKMQFGAWDDIINGVWPTQDQIFENIMAKEYPGCKPEDIDGGDGTQLLWEQSQLDYIMYGVFSNMTTEYETAGLLGMQTIYSNVVMPTDLAEYVALFQLYTEVGMYPRVRIQYSINYIDRVTDNMRLATDSLYVDDRLVNTSELNMDVPNGTKRVQVNELQPFYIAISDAKAKGHDIEWGNDKLVEFLDLKVSVEGYETLPVYYVGTFQTLFRPWVAEYNDLLENAGDVSNYFGAFYDNPLNPINSHWNFNLAELNVSDEPLDIDLNPLGESIGGAVAGVFNVEIFPSIYLWHILLIPFALGLVFAFLRYFAGG